MFIPTEYLIDIHPQRIRGNHLYHYHLVDDRMNVNCTISLNPEVKSTTFDYHLGHQLPKNVMTSYAFVSKTALFPFDMISKSLHKYQLITYSNSTC